MNFYSNNSSGFERFFRQILSPDCFEDDSFVQIEGDTEKKIARIQSQFPLPAFLKNMPSEKDSGWIDALHQVIDPLSEEARLNYLSELNHSFSELKESFINEKLFAHIHGDWLLAGSKLAGNHFWNTIPYLVEFLTNRNDIPNIAFLKNKLTECLHFCSETLNQYGAFQDEYGMSNVALQLVEKIKRLDAKQSLLLPAGWVGHAMLFEIVKKEDGYDLAIYNSGRGAHLHGILESDLKVHINAAITVPNIPFEKFEDPLFFETYLQLSKHSDPQVPYNELDLYGRLLSILDCNVSKGEVPHWITGQRGGTCSWKSLLCFLRVHLSLPTYKKLVFDIKLHSLFNYYRSIDEQFLTVKGKRDLFEQSLKKFAHTVVKMKSLGYISEKEWVMASVAIIEMDRGFRVLEKKALIMGAGQLICLEDPLSMAFHNTLRSFPLPSENTLKEFSVSSKANPPYRMASDESVESFLKKWVGFSRKFHCLEEKAYHLEQVFLALPFPTKEVDFWSGVSNRDRVTEQLYQLAFERAKCDSEKVHICGKVIVLQTAYAIIDKLARMDNDAILHQFPSHFQTSNVFPRDRKYHRRLQEIEAYFSKNVKGPFLFDSQVHVNYMKDITLFFFDETERKVDDQVIRDFFKKDPLILRKLESLGINTNQSEFKLQQYLFKDFGCRGLLPKSFCMLRKIALLSRFFTVPYPIPGDCKDLTFKLTAQRENYISLDVFLGNKRVRNLDEKGVVQHPFDPKKSSENCHIVCADTSRPRGLTLKEWLDLSLVIREKRVFLPDLLGFFKQNNELLLKKEVVLLLAQRVLESPALYKDLDDNPQLADKLSAAFEETANMMLKKQNNEAFLYLFFFGIILNQSITKPFDIIADYIKKIQDSSLSNAALDLLVIACALYIDRFDKKQIAEIYLSKKLKKQNQQSFQNALHPIMLETVCQSHFEIKPLILQLLEGSNEEFFSRILSRQFNLNANWKQEGSFIFSCSLNGINYSFDFQKEILTVNGDVKCHTPRKMYESASYQELFGDKRYPGSYRDRFFSFVVKGCQYKIDDQTGYISRIIDNQNCIYSSGQQLTHLDFHPQFKAAYDFWVGENWVYLFDKEGVKRYSIEKNQTDFIMFYEGDRRLVRCNLANHSLSQIHRFSPQNGTFVWANPQFRPCLIELKAYQLNFDIQQKNGKLVAYCREYPGYYIASCQSVSSIKGLSNYLVLENRKGARKVLIPKAPFYPQKFQQATLPFAEMQEIDQCSSYLCYDVDSHHQLIPASAGHRLLLAYLFLGIKNYDASWKQIRNAISPYTLKDTEVYFILQMHQLNHHFQDPHPDACRIRLFTASLIDEHQRKCKLEDVKVQEIGGFWSDIADRYEEYLMLVKHSTLPSLKPTEEKIILKKIGPLVKDGAHRTKKKLSNSNNIFTSELPAVLINYGVMNNFCNYNVTSLINELINSINFDCQMSEGEGVVRSIVRNRQEFLNYFWDDLECALSNDSIKKRKLLVRLSYLESSPLPAPLCLWVEILRTLAKKEAISVFMPNKKTKTEASVFLNGLLSDRYPFSPPPRTSFTFPAVSSTTKSSPFEKSEKPLHEISGAYLFSEAINIDPSLYIRETSRVSAKPAPPLILNSFNQDPNIQKALESLNRALIQEQDKRVEEKVYEMTEGHYDALSQKLLATREIMTEAIQTAIAHLEEAVMEADQSFDALLSQFTSRKITFDDLVALFLRNELDDYPKIKCSLLRIMTESTKLDRYQAALEGLEAEAISKVYEELQAKRYYDPNEYPAFLVFEYYSRLFIRSHQIEALCEFIENKKNNIKTKIDQMQFLIQSIPMGAGKTKVLLGILAYLNADEKHLSMVIAPESNLPSIVDHLQAATTSIFESHATVFSYERGDFKRIEGGNYILDLFERVKKNRGYIAATPETIQSLELDYQEMLDEMGDHPLTSLKGLESVIKYLKRYGSAIIDEADTSLDHRRELHYALSKECPLNIEYIHMVRKLFEVLLFKDKPLLDALCFNYKIRPVLSDDEYQQELFRLIHLFVNKWWNELGISAIPKKELSAFSSYLSGTSQAPDWVRELPKEKRVLIGIVKGQLSRLMAHTLSFRANEHFGLSNGPIAVPFREGEPLEGSTYQNPLEICNYTILSYLTGVASENLAEQFITWCKNQAEKEFAEAQRFGNPVPIERTPTALRFQESFKPLFEVTKDNWEQVGVLLRQNGPFFLDFLETEILHQIVIYPEKISSNGLNLVEMFDEVIGFTGTPWNAKVFHPKIVVKGSDDQVTAKTLLLIHQKSCLLTIDDAPGIQQLEEILTKCYSSDLQVIIDMGAAFCGLSNHLVATTILAFLQKKESFFKAVLYFNDKSEMRVLTESEDIPYQQCELSTDEVFGFIDKRHTTGSDIVFAKGARAIATLASHLYIRDLNQGVWRMREFDKKQKVDFVIPHSEALMIAKRSKDNRLSISNLAATYLENQEVHINQTVVRVMKQMIHNAIRYPSLHKLMTAQAKADRRIKFRDCNKREMSILKFNQDFDPWILYGETAREENTRKHLFDYRDRLLATASKLLENHEIEKLKKNIEQMVEEAAHLPLTTQIVTEDADKHQEVRQSLKLEESVDNQIKTAAKYGEYGIKRKLAGWKWMQNPPEGFSSDQQIELLHSAFYTVDREFFEVSHSLFETSHSIYSRPEKMEEAKSFETYYEENYQIKQYDEIKKEVNTYSNDLKKLGTDLLSRKFIPRKRQDVLTKKIAEATQELHYLLTSRNLPIKNLKEAICSKREKLAPLLQPNGCNKRDEKDLQRIDQAMEAINAILERHEAVFAGKLRGVLDQIAKPSLPALPLEELIKKGGAAFKGLKGTMDFLHTGHRLDCDFPTKHSKCFRYIVICSTAMEKIADIICVSNTEAALLYEKILKGKEPLDVHYTLFHISTGVVCSTNANVELEESQVNHAVMLVKFLNGSINYRPIEKDQLRVWLQSHDVQALKELFEEQIIPMRYVNRKEYKRSMLYKLFEELITERGVRKRPFPQPEGPNIRRKTAFH